MIVLEKDLELLRNSLYIALRYCPSLYDSLENKAFKLLGKENAQAFIESVADKVADDRLKDT